LLDGIDLFAYTCRHEARHVEKNSDWFPNGWDYSSDGDIDYIPNVLEPYFGSNVGGPFYTDDQDSDNDGYPDNEDYTMFTQTGWTKGNADTSDWANPGHQS